MRLLGYLFVLVLVLAAVGYFRGWYSVTTTHAGGKTGVTLGVDKDSLGEDAKAVAAKLGQLSSKAAEAVRSLGHKVGPNASELEGSVATADAVGRDLSVTVGSQTIELHVAGTVPITRKGATAGFDELRPATPVKLTFEHAGDAQKLTRIEILR
ncbi:MAG: hypothetical protein ABIP94_10385 [Planctomycetota bacterium]